MLSKHERSVASKGASKYPENMFFAMPRQGVLPRLFLLHQCTLKGTKKKSLGPETEAMFY
jgi:hypothetical protein